ncbi:MAG: DUF3857 domain-containing protein [Aureispira sp.]
MKKNYLLLALAWMVGCSQLSAQSFSDYEWKGEMAKVDKMPEEYKTAEAVVVNTETYTRGTISGTFPYLDQLSTFRQQTHLILQSDEAIEDNQRIILNRYKGRIGDYIQYKYVDVRVRKAADGKVIDYKVRDLNQPTLDIEDDLYGSKDDIFIYEIPDLVIGDEVETVTVLEFKFPNSGETVNLYSAYPTLKRSYTVSVPLKVKVDGRSYNNMPDPTIRNTSTNRIFKWEMENLRAIPEANSPGTIYQMDLEYFIYELNFDAYRLNQLSFKVKNYADYLMQYAEDYMKVRVRKKKKLEEFYEQLFADGAQAFGKSVDKLQAVEKVYLINQYIAKEVQPIREELEDFEKSEGIEYFLLNKRVDGRNLRRIYRDFFERFEIPYFLAAGRNRLNGPIDLGFVSPTQINDYFFVFKNGDGYLTISGFGGLNELPWQYYNTKVYMRNITDRAATLQEINFGDAPLKDTKNNKRFSRSQVQINLAKNSVTQKTSTSASGLYARGLRSGIVIGSKADTLIKTMQQSYDFAYRAYDDITVEVKSAKVDKFEISPVVNFNFKYSVEAEINGLMTQKEGKYLVDVDEFLSHNIRRVVNAEERALDYHVPYLGTDTEEYYLVFDQNVTLENMAALNQKIENEYASYQCMATQMKPNMIRIQSIYTTKKLFIEKEEAKKLDAVNEAFNKVRDSKLIIVPGA